MRFWVRELSGWALVLLGLFLFYTSYVILLGPSAPRLLEAGPLVFVGFVVFRGGIHLLKVALAARVCLHAQEIMAQKGPTSRDGRPRSPRVRTPLGR